MGRMIQWYRLIQVFTTTPTPDMTSETVRAAQPKILPARERAEVLPESDYVSRPTEYRLRRGADRFSIGVNSWASKRRGHHFLKTYVTCLRARSGHRRKLCLNPCRDTDRGLSRKPAQSHGGYNETHNFICLPFGNACIRTDRRCTRAGHAPDHRCPAGCSGRTKQPTTKLKQPGPHWPRTTDPAGCSSNQLTSLGGPSVCRASPSALTGLRLRCEGGM